MTKRVYKQAVASAVKITGERYCASCAAYRSVEFGPGTVVKKNGRNVRWNCQICSTIVKNRNKELKNGKATT